MKKIKLIALLILLAEFTALAQSNRCSYVTPRQTDNWLFYFNAGILFSDGSVQVNNLPATVRTLSAGNSCSVLSDADGNLLLYSIGDKVFNSKHANINPSEVSLAGNPGSPQAALIIQNPSVEQMLYVFTTDQVTNTGTKGLNMSRVDLTASAGHGLVMELNTALLANAAPLLAGVKHSNGIDFWVMTHSMNDNKFHAFKVTEAGVETNAVESSAGVSISDDIFANELTGNIKFSPKGDKIALTSYGHGIVQVFSFNNSTGEASNPTTINVTLPSPNHGPYSVEFSPDGTKVYATVVKLSSMNGENNRLYQYDLLNGSTETLLNDTPNNDDVMQVQLARNGQIYVLRRNQAVLGAIENPNREALDCNYNEIAFGLNGVKAFNGLPNFVSSYLDIPAVDYDTKCDGDATVFTLLNQNNVTTVNWNFGDPDSPTNIVAGGSVSETHMFSKPGDFTVTYTENYGGNSWTDSVKVTINPLPSDIFAADSVYIVEGSSYPVYAMEGMYSYFWQDGSTNIGYTITQKGDYTVLVEDMNCCKNMDTLNVMELDLKIPNAFSPDGDGINDYFKALGPTEGVIDFSLRVYNKWGQLLWETFDIRDKWDGKIGSTLAPSGIYNWRIALNVPGNQMNNGMIKLNGTIMLFR